MIKIMLQVLPTSVGMVRVRSGELKSKIKMKDLLNNLFPFYSGQKVVALANWRMDENKYIVEKEKIYKVNKCFKCNCGKIQVTLVGIQASIGTKCCTCGNVKQENFFNAIYFKPIQEQKFPLIKLKQIKENEETKINEFEKQILISN